MFIHLHCHSTGSFSDSVLTVKEAAKIAKALGQPAIAITDHGEIPYAYEFSKACKDVGVIPLFGAEIYFVEDAKECIEKNINQRYHMVLIAKNQKGLKNLFCILSDSWIKNSYEEKRGLVDWKLLETYSEGLIALSGCFYNILGQTAIQKGIDAAQCILKRFLCIFDKDFYIEIGRHGIYDEEVVTKALVELSSANGIIPVVTNDVHYASPVDWIAHDVIIKTRYENIKHFKANSIHYWLKSESQMKALGFPKEWLNKSIDILEKCEYIELQDNTLENAEYLNNNIDIQELIQAGKAAYLSKFIYIDEQTALKHCYEVLGNKDSRIHHLVPKITGIVRKTEPDYERIVVYPKGPIKDIIPLKRSLGKITTQWDETSCKQAGGIIVPAFETGLKEKIIQIRNR